VRIAPDATQAVLSGPGTIEIEFAIGDRVAMVDDRLWHNSDI
jgi:hypothetical protein